MSHELLVARAAALEGLKESGPAWAVRARSWRTYAHAARAWDAHETEVSISMRGGGVIL